MKKVKNLMVGAFAVALISSCGGSVDYKPAAKAMCDCMEEKGNKPEEEFDLGPEVDYASCALDVVLSEGVDINTDDFTKQLESDCPDLVELHKDYMKN